MNHPQGKRLLGLVILLSTIGISHADGWIVFDNRVNGGVKIFTQDGRTLASPYVAQLYWLNELNIWVPIAKPVNIQETGIFSGGRVAIPGDYGGKTVALQVRVWDGQSFPSFEKALDRWGNCGESEPFAATLATASTGPASVMSNFKSFYIYEETIQYCTFVATDISARLIIQEGQSTPLESVYRGTSKNPFIL